MLLSDIQSGISCRVLLSLPGSPVSAPSFPSATLCTGSGRSNACLSVVGRVESFIVLI